MPSKSPAQHRLMEAVKHSPKFAKKVGIPQSVGEEFVAADAGKSSRRRKTRSDKGEARSLHPKSHEEFIALGSDHPRSGSGGNGGSNY